LIHDSPRTNEAYGILSNGKTTPTLKTNGYLPLE
jgi:hypothetical protein